MDDVRVRGGVPRRDPLVLLAALAAALTVVLLVVLVLRNGDGGPSAGDRVAEARAAEATPQAVAEQAALAFLDVDYRDMAPRVARVLELATGQFAQEYRAAEASLVAGTRRTRSISSGVVKQVGLSAATGTTARVLVAADSTLSTAGVQESRRYRFQIELVVLDGRWLVEDLRFVS